MRLQEEGKTEQARKDLGEGLGLIVSTTFLPFGLFCVPVPCMHMVMMIFPIIFFPVHYIKDYN